LSLKEFQAKGGEILLVDTGSTDSIMKVERSLGCKVDGAGVKFIHVIDGPV
jgi:hypothetical protein